MKENYRTERNKDETNGDEMIMDLTIFVKEGQLGSEKYQVSL